MIVAQLRAAGCVFAEKEAELLLAAGGDTSALVARRVAGEPLEHVLGWASFMGLRVRVAPGVFVPRHRSALLVSTAASLTPAVAVDLCCGSGALGAGLLSLLPSVELHACDVSPSAVACARQNVPRAYLGDLFTPLPVDLRGRVDVVLANVPYVPSAEVALMPPEARSHEPLVALDGGTDGLDVLRRVALEAPSWLAPRGWLLSEVSAAQLPSALALLEAAGLSARWVTDDDTTVVLGRCADLPLPPTV